MSDAFFERPILNSPYEPPTRHWELDKQHQPTQNIIEHRRRADFITPIPKPKKRKGARQAELALDEGEGLSTEEQTYQVAATINTIREEVARWRSLPNTRDWKVTPVTERLLKHWRHHPFSSIRPFFCQVEAAETAIWLTEVAPQTANGKKLLESLRRASQEANPGLERLALKLATGAGKTTVMAMLIAWQTLNSVRSKDSKTFTRGFLVVSPGITIKDRLRVLQPNDPDNYYKESELVPEDMREDMLKARIVITNYHAFQLRQRVEISKGGRRLLEGRAGDPVQTLETEGQMLQRVMPDLMGMKHILVLNDEAHHCYREKPGEPDEAAPAAGEERDEAKKNAEAARVWISGIEAVGRLLKTERLRVVDLSATPFFLRGSGYAEGTLFPWTASDFSLMDAIECGIVKLPRVPVADNLPGGDMPMYRNLWQHIGKSMPKKTRNTAEDLDPAGLPPQLLTALDALYGHYEETFRAWEKAGMGVPPCFIIVCSNTAASKVVYDYISGYERPDADGVPQLHSGHFELFRNYNEHGDPLPRPNTLLIDSVQLESGAALDKDFRKMAADEIERFRRERVERSGNPQDAENITDEDLLREVMNTVGKEGRLGESIRCVVSVSMLTEGWDANNVTHILGVRAFGTQLLCEQVVGRALRRSNYHLDEDGLFRAEYADVLGIPFDFTAKPVIVKPQRPRPVTTIKAVRPERDHLEITFPRITGYRTELPDERLTATFNEDSVLELTPELVGATTTRNAAIIGEEVDLTLKHTGDVRPSTVLFELTAYLVQHKWRGPDGQEQLYLFGQLKRIAKEWLDNYLVCKGGTYPAQLKYKTLADMAADKIVAGVNRAFADTRPVVAEPDEYNPTGSSSAVNRPTTKQDLYETDARRCQVNYVVLDSDWEAEFCRVAEQHPKVRAYVKNHGLGFEVPYTLGGEKRTYIPDFIVLVDDGQGKDDPLHLVVEIKGYRREDAKEKKATMETLWVPGVNHTRRFGRWAFAEFTDVYEMQADFEKQVEDRFNKMIAEAAAK